MLILKMLRLMLLCLSLTTLAKEENVKGEDMKERNRNKKIMETDDTYIHTHTHTQMDGWEVYRLHAYYIPSSIHPCHILISQMIKIVRT
jgi:hypothetical protein